MPILRQSVEINASADQVWEILGTRFGELAVWANPIHRSRMLEPDVRECVTSVGTIHEKLLAFDDGTRSLTYEAVVRPAWLRRGVNRWRVVPVSSTRCRVESEADVRVAPMAAIRLLGVLPRLASMSKTMDDLRVYAETGAISDRKRRAATPPHPAQPGLVANAVFSTVTGLALLTDVGGLAAALALPEVLTRGVGAALVGFAAVVLFVARRARRMEILAVSIADLAWVGGSAVWLGVDASRWLHVGGAALCVLAVASAQLWGLRAARGRLGSETE